MDRKNIIEYGFLYTAACATHIAFSEGEKNATLFPTRADAESWVEAAKSTGVCPNDTIIQIEECVEENEKKREKTLKEQIDAEVAKLEPLMRGRVTERIRGYGDPKDYFSLKDVEMTGPDYAKAIELFADTVANVYGRGYDNIYLTVSDQWDNSMIVMGTRDENDTELEARINDRMQKITTMVQIRNELAEEFIHRENHMTKTPNETST